MMLVTQLLLLGVVTLSYGHPARFFNPPGQVDFEPVATVDCSNRQAVEYISKTHANFRCVYPENLPTAQMSNHDSAPLLFRYSSGLCPPGRVFNRRTRNCDSTSFGFPEGLQSASQIKEESTQCPLGKLYVPSIDMCLDAIKPQKTAPLESDNLIVEEPPLEIRAFSSQIQSAKHCKSNEIFNSELSLCMLARPPPKNQKPLISLNLVRENNKVPMEIQSFSSRAQSAADCKLSEIWLSEIGACVSKSKNPHPLESASLIQSTASSFPSASSYKDCKLGEVFVSEIGICQLANPPKKQKPLVSDSLVRDPIPSVAVIENIRCTSEEIFVSELNICMPYNQSGDKPAPPSSSSLVKEPEKLEIVAFSETKTRDQCKEDEFYLSELSICV